MWAVGSVSGSAARERPREVRGRGRGVAIVEREQAEHPLSGPRRLGEASGVRQVTRFLGGRASARTITEPATSDAPVDKCLAAQPRIRRVEGLPKVVLGRGKVTASEVHSTEGGLQFGDPVRIGLGGRRLENVDRAVVVAESRPKRPIRARRPTSSWCPSARAASS